MSAEAKCLCNHCSQPISFPAVGAGTTIQCPHCGLDTILFIPPPSKPETPKNFIPDKKPEQKTAAITQPSNHSQFNTALQFLQLAALICIAGFLFYDWHQKQLAATDKLTAAPVPDWEYETFEWQPDQFDADHPNQIKSTFVRRDSDKAMGGDWATNGMEVGDLTILLNHIGIEGWELVAFDGTRYIVKRPYNQNTEHDFSVESRWVPIKK